MAEPTDRASSEPVPRPDGTGLGLPDDRPDRSLDRSGPSLDRLRSIPLAAFFTLYPILAVVSTQADPVEVGLVAVATVAFIGLIVIGSRTTPTSRWRSNWLGPALVLAILAIAVSLVVQGRGAWVALFYFASTGASVLLPERRSLVLIGLSASLVGLSMLLAGMTAGDALIQTSAVTAFGLLVFSVNETRRANRALVQARHDLARLAVAEERGRIARDLHDTLGHTLSLITLKSELAGRLLPDDPERAKAEIADVEHVARDSLQVVRETIGGYRRPTLAAELAAARVALRAAQVETRIETPADPLPDAADEALAWAVREAVTNVVRHSRARHVTIRVRRIDDRATAEVIDDGPAVAASLDEGPPFLDPAREGSLAMRLPAAGMAGRTGHGLLGLTERLAGNGGHLEAGPIDGGGYRLTAIVPVRVAAT